MPLGPSQFVASSSSYPLAILPLLVVPLSTPTIALYNPPQKKRTLMKRGVLGIEHYTKEFALNHGMAITQAYKEAKEKLQDKMYKKYAINFERLRNLDSQNKSIEFKNVFLGSQNMQLQRDLDTMKLEYEQKVKEAEEHRSLATRLVLSGTLPLRSST
ncbi:hypothetical protein GH714_010490 [Hevea brasiliensis]|uniref:Uncharacterized protein n=1 Tax=Hevea brasiliensis TaxID=3981 RepID=A0A6A6LC69_HEVBR|nr:hypothetical protein GH714_010490 [Hevea brasiliensis]